MKTQTSKSQIYCPMAAIRYARVLYEVGVPKEAVQKTREIFEEVPQLHEIFANPTIELQKKMNVVDRVFPKEIRNFLKVACRYQRMNLIEDIFTAYDRYCDEQNQVLNAVLTCIQPPTEEQKKGMEAFLCKKYGAKSAKIEVRQDKALLGGFILQVGSDEYDWSMKGRLNRLEQRLTWRNKVSSINSDEIISILKEEIENFDTMSKDSEVGTVVTVGDGIATIYGIDHAMYGEIVTFENGLKGMVQDIRKNEIGCILLGSDTGIREGTKVARTGKKAGVPVGDAYVGRVVNALGEAIDGKGEIKSDDYRRQ